MISETFGSLAIGSMPLILTNKGIEYVVDVNGKFLCSNSDKKQLQIFIAGHLHEKIAQWMSETSFQGFFYDA